MKGFLAAFAGRYIAGTDRSEAIAAALELGRSGIKATIDNLGENVKSAAEARASADEYLALLDEIKDSGADSQVSLKLTHMGLDISRDLARNNLEKIVARAAELGNFVRVDMEGSACTQPTIDAFLAVRRQYDNVGIALQSCLRRSLGDARLIASIGGSIRVVKGAYKEPPSIAFQEKAEVDGCFEAIMKELMLTETRPAIATHDERLIDEAKRFAEEKGLARDSFDFEMLLGIRRSLQKSLASEGYSMRVYVPYGKDWLPYTMRRLRERKENVWFVLKNMLD